MPSDRRKGAITRHVVVQGWFHEFEPVKRDRRLKYKDPILFEMQEEVDGKRWVLGYYTKSRKNLTGWTGPFKTKEEAIKWYNGGGR